MKNKVKTHGTVPAATCRLDQCRANDLQKSCAGMFIPQILRSLAKSSV